MNRYLAPAGAVVIAMVMMACGGPEESKAKYRQHAEAYVKEGNYAKARLALRHVLKIDPKDVDAYFLAAQIEEKERNWLKAVAGYQQVVELKPDHDQAQIKIAKYCLEIRALKDAGEIADRMLAAQPGHVSAQAIKIAVMALSGNIDEAVKQAEALVAAAPTAVDPVLILASLYTSGRRPAEALPHLRRALDANPIDLEVLEALATTSMKQGYMADAEAALAQIVTVEPKVFTHRLRQVAFYDQRHQYEKAEHVLLDAVHADPNDVPRRLAMVDYLAKRRGVETAEATLRQAQKDLPRAGKLWFALGHLYESTQRSEKAREVYQEIKSEFSGKPEALDAQVKLAEMDWVSGKVEDADRQIQAVLKENGRALEAMKLRGRMAFQRGHGQDAITDFRTVVRDQPDWLDGYVLLAKAHLLVGQPELARENLDRVVMLKPTMMEAQTLLAKLDAASGKIKEAKQRVDSLLVQEPNNTALLGALFQLQLQEKDWNNSQTTLKQLRQAGADEGAAYLAEGHVALARQQWVAAEAAYNKAAQIRPSAPEPLLALVQLDMRRGHLVQAQRRLEERLAQAPDHPYASGFLGELLLTKGESAAALAHLQTATRLNPKWTTPWAYLARGHYVEKRVSDGDAALMKGLEASPDNEQLRLMLAVSLTSQQRYDEAITHYETVLRYGPSSLLAANNLAAILVDHKHDPKSLERALVLSRGFESEKSNPYLLDTLGWAHHKLGHHVDALRVLRQASTLAPDHPVLNYHLGAAYAKAGQRTEAVTHLKKAIEFRGAFDGIDEAKTLLAEVSG